MVAYPKWPTKSRDFSNRACTVYCGASVLHKLMVHNNKWTGWYRTDFGEVSFDIRHYSRRLEGPLVLMDNINTQFLGSINQILLQWTNTAWKIHHMQHLHSKMNMLAAMSLDMYGNRSEAQIHLSYFWRERDQRYTFQGQHHTHVHHMQLILALHKNHLSKIKHERCAVLIKQICDLFRPVTIIENVCNVPKWFHRYNTPWQIHRTMHAYMCLRLVLLLFLII